MLSCKQVTLKSKLFCHCNGKREREYNYAFCHVNEDELNNFMTFGLISKSKEEKEQEKEKDKDKENEKKKDNEEEEDDDASNVKNGTNVKNTENVNNGTASGLKTEDDSYK